MLVEKTELPGLIILRPNTYADHRGSFVETWREDSYKELGMSFVQDNQSRSKRGVLRGLHYQKQNPQGQLVWASEGEVFDVCVDIRKDSPTYGKWASFILSTDQFYQLYMPPGFAHGFCVLSEWATLHYKCTDYYRADDEGGIIWNDSELSINWPSEDLNISEKDLKLKQFNDIG